MDWIDHLPPEILVKVFEYLAVDCIDDLDALLMAKPTLINYIHLCNWKDLVYTQFPHTEDLEIYRKIIPGINSWYRLYRMLYEYHYQPHRFITKSPNSDILDVFRKGHSVHHDVIKLFAYIRLYGINSEVSWAMMNIVGVVKYIETLQDMGYDTISKVIDAGYYIDNNMFIGCLIFIYDVLPEIYNGNIRDDIYPIIYDRNIVSLVIYGVINTSRVYHNIIKDIFTGSNIRYLEYICNSLLNMDNGVELNTRYYKYRFIFECEHGRRYLIDRLRKLCHLHYTRNMVAFYIDKLKMRADEIIDIFMTNNVENVNLYFNLCGRRRQCLDDYKSEMSKRRLLTDNMLCKINRLRRHL
jgi:hypothetical protein